MQHLDHYPKIYLYRRLVQAKLFIDAHFGDDIDIGNMANEASFSKYHFLRLFKQAFGKSPNQYLIAVRINNAKQLLENETSVAETCERIGFNSVSTFTGLFKRITGITPSAYQQHHRDRKQTIAQSPLKYIPNCFAEKKGWVKNSNFEEENS